MKHDQIYEYFNVITTCLYIESLRCPSTRQPSKRFSPVLKQSRHHMIQVMVDKWTVRPAQTLSRVSNSSLFHLWTRLCDAPVIASISQIAKQDLDDEVQRGLAVSRIHI